MNEWKEDLVARGWVPNDDATLWLDPLGLADGTSYVYSTADAYRIQFVKRGDPV